MNTCRYTVIAKPLVLSLALGIALSAGTLAEARDAVHHGAAQAAAGVPDRGNVSPASPQLPANLEFTEALRPILQRMWAASPTFRRQCARLAEAPNLTVVLLPGRLPEHMKSRANAVTRIEGRAGQPMRAEVWLGFNDLEMNIAHEIEHILERVDGVRVELMNSLAIEGVTRYGDTFETARARETGRAVAREVTTGQAFASRRF